jgi:outer membrane lipoprotein SlyB
MVTVKRIGVASAMKVGALLYALLFTVFGLFILGFQSIAISALTNAINQSSPRGALSGGGLLAGGLAAFCIFYVMGVVFAAITGGIGGAVTAFLYNLVANWVGGVEIELSSGGEKPKREVVVEQSASAF